MDAYIILAPLYKADVRPCVEILSKSHDEMMALLREDRFDDVLQLFSEVCFQFIFLLQDLHGLIIFDAFVFFF
jgi:hypothetical protein